jgi:HEAT repeat protein
VSQDRNPFEDLREDLLHLEGADNAEASPEEDEDAAPPKARPEPESEETRASDPAAPQTPAPPETPPPAPPTPPGADESFIAADPFAMDEPADRVEPGPAAPKPAPDEDVPRASFISDDPFGMEEPLAETSPDTPFPGTPSSDTPSSESRPPDTPLSMDPPLSLDEPFSTEASPPDAPPSANPPSPGPLALDDDPFAMNEPAEPSSAAGPSPNPDTESAISDGILGLDPEPGTDDDDDTPSAPDTPELALVRKLCRALAKSVKASQLYPADNPMCSKFLQELMGCIQETFKIMDVIRLSVGKTKLFFTGEPVLEQEGRDESVPGRLFWAGVREISFHAGLTSQEAMKFLHTFRVSAHQEEQDIVSLLWEALFEHITYIAVDDILDMESESDPIPTEFGHDFMNFVDLDMHDLEDEDVEQAANEMANEIRSRFNDNDASLFGVSQEERDALLAEIEEEESPKILKDVLHIICETLYLETNEAAFVDLVQVLSGALLALIGEGRLSEAAEVVVMLRELKDGGETFTPAMAEAVDRAVAATYDEPRRQSLARHLDSSRREVMETLDAYVRVLPDTAIAPLCDVLGNLGTPIARRRMVEALAAKAQGNIEPFLGFLRDPRNDLVRNVAGILGQSRNEGALEPLRKLLQHPDFYVRRDGLAALSKLGTGKALGVLADALLDVDPRIRMTAARSLGMAGRSSIPALLTSVEDPDFDSRPLTEKRAFYEALGYAGGEDILPVFKRALKRKGWIRRSEAEEIRACACEALGWVGGDEARRLLTAQLNDKSVLVRTAAQSGLRRILGDKGGDLLKEAA